MGRGRLAALLPHAEGRVLRFVSYDAAHQPTVRYQREYTLKDHLGNLRLAYRLGQVRTLMATLEQDAPTRKRETQQFDSLSVSAPIAVATSLARSGTYAAQLNAGGASPQPLGPLTQLGVQQGDTVRVSAYGLYAQPVQHGFLFSLGAFLAGILHPGQAPPPGLDGRKRSDLPLLQVGVAAGLTSIPQLRGGVPQGYLRLLVFDKDSALVSQQIQQLSQAARGSYEALRLQVVLPQDGYVTAYVGNGSDVDVFFDDMTVEHRPGLQVQENQYDPWGLNLAGLDYNSPGLRGLNQYQFNGKERQNDLGLGWSDYGARFYDPARGPGWMNPDPLAEKMRRWSPYAFSFDNPLRFIDPDGMWPYPIHIRSFAPFPSFGGGFHGDGANRNYTTAPGQGEGGSVTSRMQHVFTVDPTQGTFKAGNTWSNESQHPLLGSATATPQATISGFKSTTDEKGNSTASFTANMSAGNPLVPGSPDIDVHTSFTLTENLKAGTLNVNAVQTGDAFPAAETFIGDTKGNQLFIGVSPAIGNPYTSLPFDGDIKMMSANFTVTLDKKGVFTGVQQGDKTYNTKDWNKIMQSTSTVK